MPSSNSNSNWNGHCNLPFESINESITYALRPCCLPLFLFLCSPACRHSALCSNYVFLFLLFVFLCFLIKPTQVKSFIHKHYDKHSLISFSLPKAKSLTIIHSLEMQLDCKYRTTRNQIEIQLIYIEIHFYSNIFSQNLN